MRFTSAGGHLYVLSQLALGPLALPAAQVAALLFQSPQLSLAGDLEALGR